ncbi:hypothetical protein [Slackia heliotrinireducens]|nr:hypothetical protein [Slackia heliotrinireducens]
MRDYVLMRQLMALAAKDGGPAPTSDYYDVGRPESVTAELKRLKADGLIDAEFKHDFNGVCVGCEVVGATEEGKAFFRLVENPDVWRIVCQTLESAGIDVSYPLLKEVCEEILKRYVTSFIPEIKPCK